MTDHDTMDVLTGIAILTALALFFAVTVSLVRLWDSTWREAVEPVRSEVYSTRLGHSPCTLNSWWWWRDAGCRVL
jgi:hypothetical protein